jgi:hypothetical protein
MVEISIQAFDHFIHCPVVIPSHFLVGHPAMTRPALADTKGIALVHHASALKLCDPCIAVTSSAPKSMVVHRTSASHSEKRKEGNAPPREPSSSDRTSSERNHTSDQLLRRRGQRHAMPPEDIHHLRTVGRAALGSTDYFGSFAEVSRTHYRGGYDDELFYIFAAEVIEAVNRASADTDRLPRANLDGCAVNRPGKDTLDTVDDLLVSVIPVGRRR